MKKTIYLISIIAVIMAGVALFCACEKLNDNEINPLKAGSGPPTTQLAMRNFSNIDELLDEIDKTIAFSFEDLVKYEQSNNFHSFGRQAEQILYSIDTNSLTSEATILKIIDDNPTYIQKIEENGENYVETILFGNIFRYVVNDEKMVRVDTLLYKAFENGLITCHVDHYNELLQITEEDFKTLQSNGIFTRIKKGTGSTVVPIPGFGWSQERAAISSDGKEKVWGEVYFMRVFADAMVNGQKKVTGKFAVCVRGYRKFMWFWPAPRTLTANITLYTRCYNNYPTGYVNQTTSGYKLEATILNVNGFIPSNVYPENVIYITGCSGFVKIPAVTCPMNF